MPKALAEIDQQGERSAAGRLADEHNVPLVVVMIWELGVDEVALLGAFRKQTRVPLIDPASIEIQPDVLQVVSRAVCARRCVFSLTIHAEPHGRVLRLAMADPTDTAAVAELEQLTRCEVDIAALPLSAIET